VGALAEAIAAFLRKSETILHFDMSGLSMPFESHEYIAERGIRKSHTLLAIHMSGTGLQPHERIQLRRLLRV